MDLAHLVRTHLCSRTQVPTEMQSLTHVHMSTRESLHAIHLTMSADIDRSDPNNTHLGLLLLFYPYSRQRLKRLPPRNICLDRHFIPIELFEKLFSFVSLQVQMFRYLLFRDLGQPLFR